MVATEINSCRELEHTGLEMTVGSYQWKISVLITDLTMTLEVVLVEAQHCFDQSVFQNEKYFKYIERGKQSKEMDLFHKRLQEARKFYSRCADNNFNILVIICFNVWWIISNIPQNIWILISVLVLGPFDLQTLNPDKMYVVFRTPSVRRLLLSSSDTFVLEIWMPPYRTPAEVSYNTFENHV